MRLSTRWTRATGVAAGIVLVASAVLLPWGIGKLAGLRSTQSWLLAHGTRTTATVEKVVQVGGEPCAVYDITFVHQDGRPIQIHGFEVLPETDPHPGEQIALAYDPSHPTILRSVGRSCGDRYGQWHWWVVIVAATLGVSLATTVLLVLGWYRFSRRRIA